MVVNPTPAVPHPSWNGPLCEEQTLQLAVTSSPGATFSWTGPASFNSMAQNPSIAHATPAVSGNYIVTATIGNCSALPANLAVLVKPKPTTPQSSANTPICEGFPLQLTASVIPGATYSWSGPAGFSAASQSTGIAQVLPLASGTYQVIATVNGCHSETASTQVLINPNPAAPFIKEQNDKTEICAGEAVIYTALSPDATDYSWSTGVDGNTLTIGKTGSYQAKAISAAGCISPASNTLSLLVHPLPAGTIVLTVSGAGVTRFWRLQAPLGASYLWNTGETSPAIVVKSSGDYDVTVTSDAGCKEIFNTHIGPQPLSIPNTFSPNGDGINDHWTIPELKNHPNAQVTVINRDGQTVFEASNFTRWDGRINGKPLPAGVYFYVVRTSADAEPYKGWLNLIR
ncbi:gliding motility-associated C-terminal domain-containing protein [Paraflavitalea speifideaquila]|uniref:gliding motility-associated C-terminal domain-containing protein n=1 Tax=Paraflavitalea speifideaquila TaxID=3076558 RepID=UPI0028E30B37|nr:gliding motility-associated C-terminal domain-containing protein [Paraflavitalea speifideiaquila]